MNAFSAATANMTPLEAMTHNAAGAVADLGEWLGKRQAEENMQ
jgi:hypothetical protein